jgi:hypothetical protein
MADAELHGIRASVASWRHRVQVVGAQALANLFPLQPA